ncbi:hypothetical protein [Aurantiacibacter odishensis]|uniref:hypothetical protein n=1 Tax=Aurantiacibacter odishensis TaxID=1155476 RepID=UPI00196A9546|nr:hypothetical protein [Aurantiacibacter odishensis]
MLEFERYSVGVGQRRGSQPETHLHGFDKMKAVTDEDAQVWHELEVAIERPVNVVCKLREHVAGFAEDILRQEC